MEADRAKGVLQMALLGRPCGVATKERRPLRPVAIGPGPPGCGEGIVMRPQLQLTGRDGKTGGLGPLHQLHQVLRRADLGLEGRISRHCLQKLPEGRALQAYLLAAGRWSIFTHNALSIPN